MALTRERLQLSVYTPSVLCGKKPLVFAKPVVIKRSPKGDGAVGYFLLYGFYREDNRKK